MSIYCSNLPAPRMKRSQTTAKNEKNGWNWFGGESQRKRKKKELNERGENYF